MSNGHHQRPTGRAGTNSDRPGSRSSGNAPLGHQRTRQPPLRRWRLRDWRVRRKLTAIVVVPTLALLVAAGVGVVAQVQRASQASAVGNLATVGRRVTGLVHQLQGERDLTAGWIAQGRSGQPAELAAERATVDVGVGAFREAVAQLGVVGGQPQRLLATADTRLASLPVLRGAVSRSALPGEAVFAIYGSIINDLLALIDEIGRATADRALAEPVRALDALARATEFSSQQRGLLLAMLASSPPQQEQLDEFLAAAHREQGALTEFRSTATPQQRRGYEDAVTGPQVDQTEQVKAAIAAQAGRALPSAEYWLAISTHKLDLMAGVETALFQELTAASDAARARTLRDGIAVISGVLLALLLAFAVVLFAARSLGRRLDALCAGALAVAHRGLPEAVARLRDGTVGLGSVAADPIPVAGEDEVGEVARAFDAVHFEAIRHAGEQAVLRRRVNEVFTNLARRSQTLVGRQLQVLYEIEDTEQDPDRLAQLYRIDHLATRMRRADESLLVLAGSESPRPLTEPAPLEQVLLAAAQEVEHYTRVDRAATRDLFIAGYVVADLVHLLAELIENATQFSPADTRVMASGRALPNEHGVVIEIADHGVGMSHHQLQEANRRLEEPPGIENAALQSMGLYVVGTLAARHDLEVRLRASTTGGTVAMVRVPQHLLTQRAQTTVRDVTGLGRATPPPSTGSRSELTVELPTLPATALGARRAGRAAVLTGGALSSFQAAVDAGRSPQP